MSVLGLLDKHFRVITDFIFTKILYLSISDHNRVSIFGILILLNENTAKI